MMIVESMNEQETMNFPSDEISQVEIENTRDQEGENESPHNTTNESFSEES
jgi:hypothetical protein